VILFQFALFLFIGLGLYVFYCDSHIAPPARLDRLYPEFIWNRLPHGLAGLLIAAILAAAMANLSAALNSLSSTVVVDFFHAPARGMSEKKSLRLARVATVFWGAVLLAVAIGARYSAKSVLETGLTIGSVPAGALLGVFLLGVLTRKPGERAAMAGMAAGLLGVGSVAMFTPVAWTWYVPIGAIVTFSAGLIGSLFEMPR
jgi:Na+/proline symporter